MQRTRLLEVLDRVEQRTILLIAPAGYGKTTLARQWVDRVGGAWVGLTAASSDVPVMARDLTAAIASVADLDLLRVETALSAGNSPCDQARAVARTVLAQVGEPIAAWIVLDDYHFAAANSAADELTARLEASGLFRFVIATRERPGWATKRRRLYMETFELTATELALDELETAQLLPPDRRTAAIRKHARGWPAVIALAAHSTASELLPRDGVLSATLYDYFAEELYEHVPSDVQRSLTTLAVLPASTSTTASRHLGDRVTLGRALETGLAFEMHGHYVVHPLAREFLLTKFSAREDASSVAREIVDQAVADRLYDDAFELLVRLALTERLEALVTASYDELMATGRVATLERFARYAITNGGLHQSLLDLIAADVALLRGDCDRACQLAQAAAEALDHEHPLKARAYLVAGRAAHLTHRAARAFEFHALAQTHAGSTSDFNEAAWGKYLAALTLEDDRLREALNEFESLPNPSTTDLVRLDTARTYGALLGALDPLSRDPLASELVAQVTDPWVRSRWGYVRGASLVLSGHYGAAEALLRDTLSYIDEYRLEFGRPYTQWLLAAAEMGLRHFARAETLILQLERRNADSRDLFMQLNVRALRARLDLVQQRPLDAIGRTSDDFDLDADVGAARMNRAMYGEYLATRAIAQATSGDFSAAEDTARDAEAVTYAVEVRVLASAARALIEVGQRSGAIHGARELLGRASTHQVWDGVVCAVRAHPPLLGHLLGLPSFTAELRQVLVRSNDVALAKSVGLVTRSTGTRGVLSPREREIMEHVRQGKRNAEIAASLFIAVGTVKRHLDHIYFKLGARSRAEAIARYAEIEIGELATSGDS